MIIENDELFVEISLKGAEITKIVGKNDNLNYIWNRDNEVWGHSAPVLFPIVGKVKNNQYSLNDKIYSMNQHGFARYMDFTVDLFEHNKVNLKFMSNEETYKQYPFNFILQVSFYLNSNKLDVSYTVVNLDNKDMYFQIGGHPAFVCPIYKNETANDYYLEFEKEEMCSIKIMDKKKGGMSRLEEQFFENEKRFFIRNLLFNRSAIIFNNLNSNYVKIKSLNHSKEIIVHFGKYPYLGIWNGNRPGRLLAIEPWYGHSDYYDYNGDFKGKESMIELKASESFKINYEIEIVQ